MRANEFIFEYRNRLLQYVKSLLPTWPEYVLKDWLVPNKGNFSNLPVDALKNGIMEKIQSEGLAVDTKWQLVPNMKFTMDMWNADTARKLQGRAGGRSDMGMGIPRDAERHATQAQLAQQQGGVRKEPVIMVKHPNGYDLVEGWHRTIQHFAMYPQGYTGPAYVGVAQEQGVAEDLTEVVDLDTAFPLKWDQQFAAQGEIHASATDADGREIGISFTPAGNGEITDVAFTRGGTHEMTGKGDAGRVMATVIKAINIYANKYKPPYLVFSAKSGGGRASAYTAMIRRAAQGYKLLPPDQYPAALGNYLEFIGSDQPFVLART